MIGILHALGLALVSVGVGLVVFGCTMRAICRDRDWPDRNMEEFNGNEEI